MAQVIAVVGTAVQLVNLAGEVWGTIDDLLHSGKGRHNLIVGKPEPGDILLHEEQKRQGYGFGYVSHIYRYSGENTITSVVAKDNWDDDTGGDSKIIDGGSKTCQGKGYLKIWKRLRPYCLRIWQK